MSMIEDIKRNRDAGADGPWVVRALENFGWNICHYIGGDKFDILRIGKSSDETNARRIARVPDLEAALIAAEELAAAIEWDDDGLSGFIPVEAFHAYRAATGAA